MLTVDYVVDDGDGDVDDVIPQCPENCAATLSPEPATFR